MLRSDSIIKCEEVFSEFKFKKLEEDHALTTKRSGTFYQTRRLLFSGSSSPKGSRKFFSTSLHVVILFAHLET